MKKPTADTQSQNPHSAYDLATARDLVWRCERAMKRRLSDGERRDLLRDNTRWDGDKVAAIVAALAATQ